MTPQRPAPWQPATAEQLGYSLPPRALVNRVILISGASGGLGSALARAVALAGATVVLSGRDEQKLDALYDELESLGAPTPATLPLNLNGLDDKTAISAIDTVSNACGRLDALVHAAAHCDYPGPLDRVSVKNWQRSFAVNLDALQRLTASAMPVLRESPLGSVLAVLDHKPGAYWGAYGLSKSALASWVHMLADEIDAFSGADGAPRVAVNGVDPGPMRTELRRRTFPGEQSLESPLPDSVIGPLVWALSRQRRAINGQLLYRS